MPSSKLSVAIASLDSAARHWQSAEAELGRAIVLKSGAGLSTLTAVQKDLSAAQLSLVEPENDREAVASQRDTARVSLRNVNSRFTASVRGLLPNTEFVAQLPALTTSNASIEKLLAVSRDLASIWSRIDALSPTAYPSLAPPLTLRIQEDGKTITVTLADYRARIDAVQSAGERLRVVDESLVSLHLRRDELLKKARTLLNEYRAAIRALFPKDSELVLTLPK